MSKAALADMLIDLVRVAEGDESMDGKALYWAICSRSEPVLLARGDRVPSVEGYRAGLVSALSRCRPCQRAGIVSEIEEWDSE